MQSSLSWFHFGLLHAKRFFWCLLNAQLLQPRCATINYATIWPAQREWCLLDNKVIFFLYITILLSTEVACYNFDLNIESNHTHHPLPLPVIIDPYRYAKCQNLEAKDKKNCSTTKSGALIDLLLLLRLLLLI